MRLRNRVATSLMIVALSLAFGSFSELRNVEVNGRYAVPDHERTAQAFFVRSDEGTSEIPFFRMQPPESNLGQSSLSTLRVPDVKIAALPEARQFVDLARVFLSLYLRVPAWDEDVRGRVGIIVTVNDYRVFECELTQGGWHPRLVDLRPWAATTVVLEFRAVWLEGEPSEIILGLPRMVACHGPFYSGRGGLTGGIGPHGMPILYNPFRDQRILSGGAAANDFLALVRVDAIEPSTIRILADGRGYDAGLATGLHWLPIPVTLDNPNLVVQKVAGFLERGPVDIVPNFLAGDEARLASIAP